MQGSDVLTLDEHALIEPRCFLVSPQDKECEEYRSMCSSAWMSHTSVDDTPEQDRLHFRGQLPPNVTIDGVRAELESFIPEEERADWNLQVSAVEQIASHTCAWCGKGMLKGAKKGQCAR